MGIFDDTKSIQKNNSKCSCGYDNSETNNYCVKCGKLLPGRNEISCISTVDFLDYMILKMDYEELKKEIENRSKMSKWDKIKEALK